MKENDAVQLAEMASVIDPSSSSNITDSAYRKPRDGRPLETFKFSSCSTPSEMRRPCPHSCLHHSHPRHVAHCSCMYSSHSLRGWHTSKHRPIR